MPGPLLTSSARIRCEVEEFSFLDYELPQDRIAQRPIGKGDARSNSRLLCARLRTGDLRIDDYHFSDLPRFLESGDLLVLNNTQVMPCRFFVKTDPDCSDVEVLLVRRCRESNNINLWEALARPMKRLKKGVEYKLSATISGVCCGRTPDGSRILLELKSAGGSIDEDINIEALMPIPPYIRGGRSDVDDRESYQTIYARKPGSIAAPTAGLHFTSQLIRELDQKGIKCCDVTLHVGSASFIPIRDGEIASHKMAVESYEIPIETAGAIYQAKKEGRRVIIVGTTSLRALESAVRTPQYSFLDGLEDIKKVESGRLMETDLYITPGFDFRVADVLITNFHQPRSTHLLLVAAFIGADAVKSIYNHAMNLDYRFLSYGDGMMLIPDRNRNG